MKLRKTEVSLVIIPPALIAYQDQAPTRYLDSLIRETSQRLGILILVDSTASGAKVAPPELVLNGARDIEPWLNELVKNIPGGASWVKLWLPPPPKGKRWTGDEVANFALSLSKLYGTVGAVEPGKSEVLATQLPDTTAASVKSALQLQPVYLITRRGVRTFAGKWSATFGELTIEIRGSHVTGFYPSSEGVIEGVLIRDRIEFTWTEHGSSSGKGWFKLSDDGTSFSGMWGSGDEEPNREWVGKRIYEQWR